MDWLVWDLSALSAGLWIIILLLPWRPWLNGETLEPSADFHLSPHNFTVVIPARNEAEVITDTLQGLAAQGSGVRVILVDDGSEDGTAELALNVPDLELTVVRGSALPSGWSGKLWALQQGVLQVNTRYTLLLDADIRLAPGMLATLLKKAESEDLPFVSIMARLRMESFWERLLMPAFIHFFKMLYPFRLANSRSRNFTAAAGGCILLETRIIHEMGGFAVIRDALIDDCSLATKVKSLGFRTWIGQSHGVISLRAYDQLDPIWEMVERTAFSQLRYSPLLLSLCTLIMLSLYWVPWIGLFFPHALPLSLLAVLGMCISYLPTLVYYRLSRAWTLLMPIIAGSYLAMTWSSALRFWRGERSRWKNRVYRTEETS